jgi:hypothetical protein
MGTWERSQHRTTGTAAREETALIDLFVDAEQ